MGWQGWHTCCAINRHRGRDSVLVDSQHVLFYYGYPERSNNSRQKFGTWYRGKPVNGGRGKQGSVNIIKVVYSELPWTPYQVVEVPLVPLLRLFGAELGQPLQFVNFRVKELL